MSFTVGGISAPGYLTLGSLAHDPPASRVSVSSWRAAGSCAVAYPLLWPGSADDVARMVGSRPALPACFAAGRVCRPDLWRRGSDFHRRPATRRPAHRCSERSPLGVAGLRLVAPGRSREQGNAMDSVTSGVHGPPFVPHGGHGLIAVDGVTLAAGLPCVLAQTDSPTSPPSASCSTNHGRGPAGSKATSASPRRIAPGTGGSRTTATTARWASLRRGETAGTSSRARRTARSTTVPDRRDDVVALRASSVGA